MELLAQLAVIVAGWCFIGVMVAELYHRVITPISRERRETIIGAWPLVVIVLAGAGVLLFVVGAPLFIAGKLIAWSDDRRAIVAEPVHETTTDRRGVRKVTPLEDQQTRVRRLPRLPRDP